MIRGRMHRWAWCGWFGGRRWRGRSWSAAGFRWRIELFHAQGRLAGGLEHDHRLLLIQDHQAAIELLLDVDEDMGQGGPPRRRRQL